LPRGVGDLFAMFPDLPRPPRPSFIVQQQRMLQRIAQARERAWHTAARQRAAVAQSHAQWTASRIRVTAAQRRYPHPAT
jgi:hypothetical protein